MPIRAVVAPPQATVPVHSLVRSADTSRDSEPRWENGLTYLPEATGGYVGLSGCSEQNVDHTAGLPPVVDYQPWELQVIDPCPSVFQSARPGSPEWQQAAEDRMNRVMAAVESYAIARELMTGELSREDVAISDEPVNLYLASHEATVLNAGAAVSANRAIGLLEEAVGDALHGQQATLHVPRVVRPYLWTGGTQQVGSPQTGVLFYTSIGSSIISDAGYANVAPASSAGGAPVAAAANVGWIYATGPVVVRRTAVDYDARSLSQVIDTRTNTITRKINKRVAAHFDTRALFAVPVTLS